MSNPPARAFNPREWLREKGLSPKKSFGQNFLTDAHVLGEIARASVPDAEVGKASVLEIGAGLGALTEVLLPRSGELAIVERDRDFIPLLAERFPSVKAFEADAKTFDYADFFSSRPSPRVLVGNLPYQITGPLLTAFCGIRASVDRVVIMVQKEVADRLLAEVGSKEYGALTVFVSAQFRTSRVLTAGPHAFFPPPNVSSTVIELLPIANAAPETDAFRKLVQGGFQMRRKTLRNAWASLGAPFIEKIGNTLDLQRRGETLSPAEYHAAARLLETIEE